MKNKQDIEKLTEQTLNSLDNIQHVEANEFLYAKVVNRIRTGEIEERVGYQKLMLKLSVALGLFICLNAVSFYAFEKLNHKPATTTKKSVTGAAAFAQEYSLKDSSYNY